MPPRKIPDAEDRGEAVIRNPDADIVDLDAERRKRAQLPDTNANNDPAEPGAEGGGAQNEPI
jgi:hypothetical protein